MGAADEHKSIYLESDFLKVKPARNPYARWKKIKKGVSIITHRRKIDLDRDDRLGDVRRREHR